jgi:hypothetical protein
VTVSLCVLQIILCPAYAISGRDIWEKRQVHAKSLERDIKAGVPVNELVNRYRGLFYPFDDCLESQLRSLRNARIGIFSDLQVETLAAQSRSADQK